MIVATLRLLQLLQLDPLEATIAAARLAGAPGWTSELLDLVAAESRGVAVGIHTGHVRRVGGERFFRAATRAGVIDPAGCEHHAEGGARWGIRGAHGLAAAYSVAHLGTCVAPEAIDVPLLSALAAVRRLQVLEQRYGLRSRPERARAWRLGVGAARRR